MSIKVTDAGTYIGRVVGQDGKVIEPGVHLQSFATENKSEHIVYPDVQVSAPKPANIVASGGITISASTSDFIVENVRARYGGMGYAILDTVAITSAGSVAPPR